MAPLDQLFGKDGAILRETDLQLLLLATMTLPLGVGVVSPMLDTLVEPFGASPNTIGLMISALTAPGIVLIPVAGVLADRYGRRTLLVPSLLLYGSAGVAISFTTNFQLVLGLRVLQGVAFAGINPVIITALGDLYDGSRESTAQGLRFMAAGLSLVVVSLVVGFVVELGWQYPFWLYAVTVPTALMVYLLFEETTGQTEDADNTGARLAQTSPSGSVDRPNTSGIKQIVSVALRRDISAVLLGRGLLPAVWVGFLTYNSILVVRILDGTPRDAAALVVVGSLALSVGASQSGRAVNLVQSRDYPLIGGVVSIGAGFLLVAFASSVTMVAVGLVVFGAGFGVNGSLYRSIINGMAPHSVRGGIIGLGESLGRVTGTLTPIGLGYAIGMMTPSVGFAAAVRWGLIGVGVITGVGGVLAVLSVRRSRFSDADAVAVR